MDYMKIDELIAILSESPEMIIFCSSKDIHTIVNELETTTGQELVKARFENWTSNDVRHVSIIYKEKSICLIDRDDMGKFIKLGGGFKS